MNGIKILGTGKCLPEKIVTNEMFTEYTDTSDEWIKSRTGMKTRHFCVTEDNLYLAAGAGRNAILNAGISVHDIGAVITATFSGDYFVPSTACLVQRELGLDENILCFDLNAACSGFIYGIETARGLLNSLGHKYVLVIGSEVIPRKLDMQDRSTCILFGDGAGAAVIGSSGDRQYQSVYGCRGNAEDLYCSTDDGYSHKIHMNGKEIYKFAVRTVPDMIKEVVKKAGTDLSCIDLFLCHQANSRIIESVAKNLALPGERFYNRPDLYANTSAASIPIALSDINDAGMLKRGMKIVLAGFGAGLTWGAVLLEW